MHCSLKHDDCGSVKRLAVGWIYVPEDVGWGKRCQANDVRSIN